MKTSLFRHSPLYSLVLMLLIHVCTFSLAVSKRSLTIVAAKATKEPETTVNSTVDDSSAAIEDALKSVQEAVRVHHEGSVVMLLF